MGGVGLHRTAADDRGMQIGDAGDDRHTWRQPQFRSDVGLKGALDRSSRHQLGEQLFVPPGLGIRSGS